MIKIVARPLVSEWLVKEPAKYRVHNHKLAYIDIKTRYIACAVAKMFPSMMALQD